MGERTEWPFFQKTPHRVSDEMMLEALKRWVKEHPTGIRSRALTVVIEAVEARDG